MNIITLQVDKDDLKDIKKKIWTLQKLRKKKMQEFGYIGTKFNTSKFDFNQILNKFDSILNTDITSVIQADNTDKSYYVYMHCDPTKKIHINHSAKEGFLAIKYNLTYVPFYVGKGQSNRLYDFNRNDSHRKIRTYIRKKDKEIIPVKIQENLTELEALSLESKLIDILGLKSINQYGMLVNLDEGNNSLNRRMLYPIDTRIILSSNGYKLI